MFIVLILFIVWADNGDAISIIYTGTGALKADFTRTGKRSFVGLLQDGIKSANRYVLNNFNDGITQDSMNLVLGKYIVDQNIASPFKASRTTVKNIVCYSCKNMDFSSNA